MGQQRQRQTGSKAQADPDGRYDAAHPPPHTRVVVMADIRFEIPKGTGASKCRGCEEFIYWVKTRAGKNMPVNADGTSHFATCKKADQFRKDRKPQIVIAPAKFLPLLKDIEDVMDEIETNDDAKSHDFVESLLLLKDDNNLHQITQDQFLWLERLHQEYCA